VHESVGQHLPGAEQSGLQRPQREQGEPGAEQLQQEHGDVRPNDGFIGGCYAVEHRDSMGT
jgi:hypothetical protein